MKNAMNVRTNGLSKTKVIKAVTEKFFSCDVLAIHYNNATNRLIVTEFDGIGVTKWLIRNFVNMTNCDFSFVDMEIMDIL